MMKGKSITDERIDEVGESRRDGNPPLGDSAREVALRTAFNDSKLLKRGDNEKSFFGRWKIDWFGHANLGCSESRGALLIDYMSFQFTVIVHSRLIK